MDSSKSVLVTGAAGFIGSCFAIQEINKGNKVVALDICSYASNMDNLKDIKDHPDFTFVKGDIGDEDLVSSLLKEHEVDWLVHFAAESHVDNSIKGPEIFIQTNVLGTYHLLACALKYWNDCGKPEDFRFLHVSTDEVFGELALDGDDKFHEETAYAPNSPYSASKAGSDHLARAWFHTFSLPVVITNCSNNYGPRQHHEKLIPHMIKCALAGKDLPIYGKGENIRDWIYVEDHTNGIHLALEKAELGSSYCFGGNSERQNIEVVKTICDLLDQLKPKEDGSSYKDQMTFVEDRLGHDLRYAIDDTKAKKDLGYSNDRHFEDNLKQTIQWYLDNDSRLA